MGRRRSVVGGSGYWSRSAPVSPGRGASSLKRQLSGAQRPSASAPFAQGHPFNTHAVAQTRSADTRHRRASISPTRAAAFASRASPRDLTGGGGLQASHRRAF